MFNSPRPAQRYVATSSNGFGGSFVDENPLAASAYDGLDPWSAAPSPTPTPAPSAPSIFSAVIADATVPAIYNKSFAAADPNDAGETSVNALSRVLGTSSPSLPAATIDKIVNLVSSRPRVSKLEFFVALALVALAQSGKDVSIEQVASLSAQNTLPEPSLDLQSLQPSTSSFAATLSNDKQNNIQNNTPTIRSPMPTYSSDDPWSTARFNAAANPSGFDGARRATNVASSLSGSGMPKDWWKKQESVHVTILGQQGFILNRYTVYEISTDKRGSPVLRRYSEFVFLWDCLSRRYPFRLFPALPPKRVGPDEYFLEQRRRGLARSLNFVVNHPIIKDDGFLAVFLKEPSLEAWRKHSSVSLEEESVSKRVDRVEEMGIPSDLEEKLAVVRGKINPLIEQWQRICILAERIIKRHEAAAVRTLAFRRTYLPAHFAFSSLYSTSSSPTRSPYSSASSIFSGTSTLATRDTGSGADFLHGQSDLSRLTNTLRAVIETNEHPWRGDDCELSNGVRQGLEQVAIHTQRSSDLAELQTRTLMNTTLESLKTQRDLYMAMRDLFIRHDRLSIDQVERLRKRVETNSLRLEGIKAAQKEGWQDEADRIIGVIEKDQASIGAQLNRRVFIRACMWHELRVVLHNRENTLLTLTVQTFARQEQEYSESVLSNWVSLGEAVNSMPFE